MQNISAEDFYKPTPYNQVTKNQIWLSQIQDSHDNFCHCYSSFAHLLASIFPPGHKDRDFTINQILARDYKAQCLSGGKEEESHGLGDGGAATASTNIKEDELEEGDVEELLAAAAAIEKQER